MQRTRRRLAFASLLLLVLYGLLEAGSFLALWALEGQAPSIAAMQEMQRARAGQKVGVAQQQAPEGATSRAGSSHQALHPYLGYVGNFDKNAVREQRDSGVFTRHGFEGPTPTLQKRAPDRLIIGVSGGSVAQIFAREGTARLGELLQASPAFAGREPVFVSLGMGGFKQPQQLHTLTYLLALGGEFDLLLNLDGFNEVALHPAENAHRNVYPIFPRNWYQRVRFLPDRPWQLMSGQIYYLETTSKRWAMSFLRSPWPYSFAEQLVWHFRDGLLQDERIQAEARLREYAPAERSYLSTGPRRSFANDAELFEHLVAIWKRCSLQMHQLCEAQAIEYVHFLQPNQYVEGSKPLTAEEREVAFVEDHSYRPGVLAGYPLLLEAGRELRAEGVRFHDLTQVFVDVEEPLYIDSCCHFNAEGNRILAEVIAQAILADRPVPGDR